MSVGARETVGLEKARVCSPQAWTGGWHLHSPVGMRLEVNLSAWQFLHFKRKTMD